MTKLTPKQFEAITLCRYGLGPRPKDVPHITKLNYGYVLLRWQRYDAWNAWMDKGKPLPRPVGVWKKVPFWEPTFGPWDLRRAIVKARPAIPKPEPIPTVPPLPPVPASAAQFQFLLVLADNVKLAESSPAKYKKFFTADPAYDSQATMEQANEFRKLGSEVGVWFVPTEVSLARAKEIAKRIGTTVIMGQAESSEQFDISWSMGLKAVVGNLSSLNIDRRADGGLCWYDEHDLVRSRRYLIATGQMIFVQENYWNAQPWLQLDYMGLPVVSNIIAVYDAHGENPNLPPGWNPQLQDYISSNRFHKGDGSYGPGMTKEQYAALP